LNQCKAAAGPNTTGGGLLLCRTMKQLISDFLIDHHFISGMLFVNDFKLLVLRVAKRKNERRRQRVSEKIGRLKQINECLANGPQE
jgi:hypothetical protein